MRSLIISATILSLSALSLSACGGGGYHKAGRDVGYTPSAAPATIRLASGPISKACLASDRKARSLTRCGCIQAVANDTLSHSSQRRAASFYSDPHLAQSIRQSDNSSNERFWQSYKDYAEAAAAVCSQA
ncbi:hypothetical protein U5922_011035 [Aquicoccus sp. G2-2]|uniref:hypothetical protein n=1 Tax=Aquicoccus sp. G2-2 TaxID=3092120 RepID=UPI002ADFD6F2|nr:hypothetical protein [Aquicoccus sp. G2-2]MEA1113972.1 hypothetical protein [Aquicoccus sp. G2-2]